MTPPCRDCPNSYVGCHSECRAYQAFRSECESRYQLRRDLALRADYIAQQTTKRLRRNRVR